MIDKTKLDVPIGYTLFGIGTGWMSLYYLGFLKNSFINLGGALLVCVGIGFLYYHIQNEPNHGPRKIAVNYIVGPKQLEEILEQVNKK